MNILKSISQTKLVIMVTHEQALADYYADRVIELANGAIIEDYANEKGKNLVLEQEQIIYLKDYEENTFENVKEKVIIYE